MHGFAWVIDIANASINNLTFLTPIFTVQIKKEPKTFCIETINVLYANLNHSDKKSIGSSNFKWTPSITKSGKYSFFGQLICVF